MDGTLVGARDSDFPNDNNDDEPGSESLPSALVTIFECLRLGSSTEVGTMIEASAHVGELSDASANIDEDLGIFLQCAQGEIAVYYAKISISSNELCGEYRIEAHAVNVGAEAPVLNNSIDVFCPVGLDIVAQPVDDRNHSRYV